MVMKSRCAAVLTVIALTHAVPVLALDATSARTYCDEVNRAAQNARTFYVDTYQPRANPVSTFGDSIGSCLEFISMFDVGFSMIPNLEVVDKFLRNMATKLLQRTCTGAVQQFDRVVSDAGRAAGMGDVSASLFTNDIGSTAQRTVESTIETATDRVVNLLK